MSGLATMKAGAKAAALEPRARLLNVTREQYYSDPCEIPSLSASIAKEIVSRSPLHAWLVHPRFGAQPNTSSRETDEGSLLHAILLGQGFGEFAILPFDNFQTRAARAARDEARALGKTVVLEQERDDALERSAEIIERMTDVGNVLSGKSEIRVEWTETVTTEIGKELVLCRGAMDHLMGPGPNGATIYDLKSTRSADLKSIGRHIVEYGYDIQGAAYSSAISKLHPECLGRVDFVDVFFEKEPPYAVTPVRFSGQLQNLGELKWERALRTWAKCLRAKHWPAYVEEITAVDAPAWALVDELA